MWVRPYVMVGVVTTESESLSGAWGAGNEASVKQEQNLAPRIVPAASPDEPGHPVPKERLF